MWKIILQEGYVWFLKNTKENKYKEKWFFYIWLYYKKYKKK